MKTSKMCLMGFIYLIVVLGLTVSCGKSKPSSEGLAALTPINTINTNLGLEGSGNNSASSVQQYRELIRQGSFVRSSFRFGDREEYVHRIGTCTTVYNDFLWIDDIPSQSCTETNQNIIREYTNGQVNGHVLGETKTAIINGLLSLMDRAQSVYLVSDNNQVIYGGGQSSRLRVILNEDGSETVYYYDLRRPLAANPASAYTENSSGADIIQLIEYAYPQ